MNPAAAVPPGRFGSQLLTGPPARRVEDVVGRLLAVQAQDDRGARLAVRCRSVGLRSVDVDDALTTSRTLVVSWLIRGTLHLVTAADYWWLHDLTAPGITRANVTRLRQEGVDAAATDQGVDVIAEATSGGPRTRAELRARLDRAGVPTAGQALVHLLLAASLRGHLVRGPIVDGSHAFVAAPDWLGPAPAPLERRDALARLARRYLAGHGPAEAADLAKWAGIGLRDARAALGSIAGEVVAVGDLVALPGRRLAAPLPPKLLGPFDPLLHGWASRDAVVGRHGGIVTTNGIFRPIALVDGRAVATWGLPDGVVTLRPLEPIGDVAASALEAEAAGVLRYLGLPPAAMGLV